MHSCNDASGQVKPQTIDSPQHLSGIAAAWDSEPCHSAPQSSNGATHTTCSPCLSGRRKSQQVNEKQSAMGAHAKPSSVLHMAALGHVLLRMLMKAMANADASHCRSPAGDMHQALGQGPACHLFPFLLPTSSVQLLMKEPTLKAKSSGHGRSASRSVTSAASYSCQTASSCPGESCTKRIHECQSGLWVHSVQVPSVRLNSTGQPLGTMPVTRLTGAACMQCLADEKAST